MGNPMEISHVFFVEIPVINETVSLEVDWTETLRLQKAWAEHDLSAPKLRGFTVKKNSGIEPPKWIQV